MFHHMYWRTQDHFVCVGGGEGEGDYVVFVRSWVSEMVPKGSDFISFHLLNLQRLMTNINPPQTHYQMLQIEYVNNSSCCLLKQPWKSEILNL